mmetsp:Transcript_1786/g.3122  ORF Transcript_1786/g.3122 Transcript_1786/m.3122 type:complete len:189 (-) Transcript_1786:185-751(-)
MYAPKKNYGHPQSTVQSLLYGGGQTNDGPLRSGKKASNMAHEVKPSPFAQWNVDNGEVYHQIHSRRKHGGSTQDAGQYKVGGAGGFDPAVYRANIENNVNNRNSSRARAHGGAGLLSHYGQEDPGHCPTASGEKVGYGTKAMAQPVQPVVVHAAGPPPELPPMTQEEYEAAEAEYMRRMYAMQQQQEG